MESPERREQQWLQPKTAKTILLADDEPSVRTLLLAILQQAGYNVIVAVDGRDGVEKSAGFKETIDVLLSDIQMPNMTGIELATRIQTERPEVRVLLMSGAVTELSLPNETWHFLPKPFTPNVLKERIQHILVSEAPDRSQAATGAGR